MPQFNPLFTHNAFDPTGGTLTSMVKHGKRAYDTYQAGKEVVDFLSGDNRPSTKWLRLNEVGERRQPRFSKNFPATPNRMAYRKRSYRRRPARRGRKRYARRGRRVPRTIPSLWPRKMMIKGVVASGGSFTGTAGAITAQALKCNSLSDPTGWISSQLPLGTDQWAGLYTKYVVVGARIICDFHATTATGGVNVGISRMDSATTLSAEAHYRELPSTRFHMMSSDADRCRIVQTFSTKKHFKVRRISDNTDRFGGSYSTSPGDPAELAYWHLWIGDSNGTDTATADFSFKIEFIIMLLSPVVPTRSQA